MWAKRLLLAIVLAGTCCWARAASATGAVHNSFSGYALLGSKTQGPHDSRTIALRLRVGLLIGDNEADDGGGASFTCKAFKKGYFSGLPCPAPKGRMEFNGANGVPWGLPSPFGEGFFPRYVVPIYFDDGAVCVADAYPILGLGAAVYMAVPGPLIMFGTYACTRDGAEFDHGTLTLWQQGSSRLRSEQPRLPLPGR